MLSMFGKDYLSYYYDKTQGSKVLEEMIPVYKYEHSLWEEEYNDKLLVSSQRYKDISQNQAGPIKKKARKSLFDAHSSIRSSNNHTIPSSTITSNKDTNTSSSPPKQDSTQTKLSSKKTLQFPVNSSCSSEGPIYKKPRTSLSDDESSTPNYNHSSIPSSTMTSKHNNTSPSKKISSVSSPQKQYDGTQATPLSHKKIQCPVNQLCSSHDPHLCKTVSGASRRQLANIVLPRIQPICHKDISVLHQPILGESDPYNLAIRPSQTALHMAKETISNVRKAKQIVKITGVKFENIGTFKLDDISALQKFCDVDDLRKDVLFEFQWLNLDDGLQDKDVDEIASALWDNTPSKVILKVSLGASTRAIDATSFSYICGERYLDNMVIDVCLTKYMWYSNESGFVQTLVLPSSVWDWESAQNDYLKQQMKICVDQSKSTITQIQQIIIPLHMPSHWGIIYINLQDEKLFFDDGMKYSIPNHILTALKHILEVLHELYPHCTSLSSGWWRHKKSLGRLGMPSQLADDAKRNGQGSGSCGLGVILTARDLMINGNQGAFSWTYAESRRLRKHLMLQILEWAL